MLSSDRGRGGKSEADDFRLEADFVRMHGDTPERATEPSHVREAMASRTPKGGGPLSAWSGRSPQHRSHSILGSVARRLSIADDWHREGFGHAPALPIHHKRGSVIAADFQNDGLKSLRRSATLQGKKSSGFGRTTSTDSNNLENMSQDAVAYLAPQYKTPSKGASNEKDHDPDVPSETFDKANTMDKPEKKARCTFPSFLSCGAATTRFSFATVLILFTTGLICTVLGASTGLHIPILRISYNLLKRTGLEITDSLSTSHQEAVVLQAAKIVQNEVTTNPRCAGEISLAFRQGRLSMANPDNISEVGRFLRAMTDYYDAGEIIAFSSKSGDMIVREKVGVLSRQQAEPAYVVWNTEAAVPGVPVTTRSVVARASDSRGYPLGDVIKRLPDLDLLTRPWFVTAREQQTPVWVQPFNFVNSDQDVGVQSCANVYDKSGLPKLDQSSIGGPSASESLDIVVCCGGSLRYLSQLMSDQEGLGLSGAAFMVNNDAPGQLVASAQFQNPLPYDSAGATNSKNPVVSTISRYLQERYTWGSLPNVSVISRNELETRNPYFKDFSWSQMDVYTWRLAGAIPDWQMDFQGNWAPTTYTVPGQNWYLIFCLATNDFFSSQLEDVLDDTERKIMDNLRDDLVLLGCTAFFAAFVSGYIGLKLRGALMELDEHMYRIQNLQFDGSLTVQGMSREIHNIQKSFHAMRDFLQLFGKFVPKVVMERMTSQDAKASVGASILCMYKCTCTVMMSTFENFFSIGAAGSYTPDMLVQIIELYVKTCADIIEEHGGILGDWNEHQILAFWTDKSTPNHAARACSAVVKQGAALRKLSRSEEWAQRGLPVGLDLHITFGLHTGDCLEGNFGSPMRMKYGVIGHTVSLAQRVANLNTIYRSRALVSAATQKLVHQAFHCEFVDTISIRGEQGKAEEQTQIYQLNIWRSDSTEGELPEVTPLAEVNPAVTGYTPTSGPSATNSPPRGSGDFFVHVEAEENAPDTILKNHGLIWIITSLCIGLIFVTIAAATAIDVSAFRAITGDIYAITRGVSRELITMQQNELLDTTVASVSRQVFQLAMCAERIAVEFRDGRVSKSKKDKVHELLEKMTTYWDVKEAIIGFKDNDSQMAFRKNSRIPGQPPAYTVKSSLYNTPPNNVTVHTDSTLVEFVPDENGIPILQSATVSSVGYQPRKRPWFNSTRWHMMPAWTEPYVWITEQALGTDACVPIYDNSNAALPKLDPSASYDGVNPQESLSLVACCGGTLDQLSAILSQQSLAQGKNGISFIVHTEGANVGYLLAAADSNGVLPIAQRIVEDDGQVNYARFEATGSRTTGLLAAVSQLLLQKYSSWDRIPITSFSVAGSSLVSADNTNASFASNVSVRTGLLDGSIKGWNMGPDGGWSRDPYQTAGMMWLVVVAVVEDDFTASVKNGLDETSGNISVFLAIRCIAAVCLLGLAVFVTCMNTRRVANPIKYLKKQMDQTHKLKFDGTLVPSSRISEVRSVQETFIHMRHCLKSFGKFVPQNLITRITSPDPLVRTAAQQLGMHRGFCTVMHSDLQGFASMSENLNPHQLVNLFEMYLTQAIKVIMDLGGTLDDFKGDQLIAFWPAETSQDHSLLAAGAVLQLSEAIAQLPETAEWRERKLPPFKLRCRFGLHRGECLIGNFGTPKRLKYGVFGEVIKVAQSLRRLNQMLGESSVLVSEAMREALHGSYLCSIVGQTVLPGDKNASNVYALMPRSGRRIIPSHRKIEDASPSKGKRSSRRFSLKGLFPRRGSLSRSGLQEGVESSQHSKDRGRQPE